MSEENRIRETIEEAYVGGIHTLQDRSRVDVGFHPDFSMLIRRDSGIEKVCISTWLDRVKQAKKDDPDYWNRRTRIEFEFVDIERDTASIKLRTYKGESLFSIDFMLLYRLSGEWKVVSKVFSLP